MQATSTHSLTIRNLSPETALGIKAYAKAQGKSVEAFLRTLLDQTVRPQQRVKLGSLLQSHGNGAGDLALKTVRDKTPYVAPNFD